MYFNSLILFLVIGKFKRAIVDFFCELSCDEVLWLVIEFFLGFRDFSFFFFVGYTGWYVFIRRSR